jgi:hypothetical protein
VYGAQLNVFDRKFEYYLTMSEFDLYALPAIFVGKACSCPGKLYAEFLILRATFYFWVKTWDPSWGAPILKNEAESLRF